MFLSHAVEHEPDLVRLISALQEQGGTDLHLKVGKFPVISIDGKMVNVNTPKLTSERLGSYRMSLSAGNQEMEVAYDKTGNVDFAFSFKEDQRRFRANICKTRGETHITIRRLPHIIPSNAQLGIPQEVVRLLNRPKGLILITGATGTGKTTTLASLIQERLSKIPEKAVIIEDPTEYVIEDGVGVVIQREVGIDVPSFLDGVMNALRQTPRMIVIGEIRDNTTMRAALTAAETGHIVLGSLHTASAYDTISRIVDSFPGNEKDSVRAQLAASLLGIVSQRLLRKISGGRVAAFEVLIANSAIQNHIRQANDYRIRDAISQGRNEGMRLLEQHLVDLVRKGVVERDAAIAAANDAKTLAGHLPQDLEE